MTILEIATIYRNTYPGRDIAITTNPYYHELNLIGEFDATATTQDIADAISNFITNTPLDITADNLSREDFDLHLINLTTQELEERKRLDDEWVAKITED